MSLRSTYFVELSLFLRSTYFVELSLFLRSTYFVELSLFPRSPLSSVSGPRRYKRMSFDDMELDLQQLNDRAAQAASSMQSKRAVASAGARKNLKGALQKKTAKKLADPKRWKNTG